MKATNPIIKVVAVSCFLILITGFVAYRSGAFTDTKTPIPEKGEKPLADTPPPVNPVIMNSTKSGKVIEPKKNNSDNILKSTEIMSSSKSGIVVDDELTKDLNSKNDSATVAKQDSLLEQALLRELIMGSSKSGAIILPKQDTSKKKPKK
ncbi:MAG: hypothetical protein Q8M29_19355 [Bacteroidota bacterium]|nr:hypothetical protein [Bacteroidota bacterium]